MLPRALFAITGFFLVTRMLRFVEAVFGFTSKTVPTGIKWMYMIFLFVMLALYGGYGTFFVPI